VQEHDNLTPHEVESKHFRERGMAHMNSYEPDHQAPNGTSSKRTFIIVGAVAVVLLVGGGVVIAAAIGLFVFTNRLSDPPRDYDPPRPANLATNREFPKTQPDSPDRTEALINALKQRPTIGGFSLQNVVPAHSARQYQNSSGEVKGIYTSSGKTVTFLVAQYESKVFASVEFGRMIGRAKNGGTRIIDLPKVTGKTINARFETGTQTTVAFCNWPDNAAVLCHQVTSNDATAMDEFRAALKDGR
jgi:hypothetical protein